METEESDQPSKKLKKSYSTLHLESVPKEKRLKKYATILHVDVNYLKSDSLNNESVNTTLNDQLDETNIKVPDNEIVSLDEDNSSVTDCTNNEANESITKSISGSKISDPDGRNLEKIRSKPAHEEEVNKKKMVYLKVEMEKLKNKDKDNKMKIEKSEKKFEKVKEELKRLQKCYESKLELNQRLQIKVLDKMKEREAV